MKKRGESGIAAVLALGLICAVLSGCGGTGGATGGGGIPPGQATKMGGSIQGTPLSLANSVTTFAGALSTGSQNGIGTGARFDLPIGITTDGTSLYIADSNNHTIRKIEILTKTVTTLAGTPGVSGFTDGSGATATFNSPYGITTDGTNLYVVDTFNNAIRKVEIATKIVSTLAGNTGASGFTDGSGASATFNLPQGITWDGTNLYVTDSFNNAIRRVVIATRNVTTIAGNTGVSGFTDGSGAIATFTVPVGITTDGTNLYVADTFNNVIRKVNNLTGNVTTFAGSGLPGSVDGNGLLAELNSPYGITMDGTNLYVADSDNHTIRKVVIATKDVTTLAGTPGLSGFTDGTGATARFNFPYGITTDGIDLYVADSNNNEIRVIK